MNTFDYLNKCLEYINYKFITKTYFDKSILVYPKEPSELPQNYFCFSEKGIDCSAKKKYITFPEDISFETKILTFISNLILPIQFNFDQYNEMNKNLTGIKFLLNKIFNSCNARDCASNPCCLVVEGFHIYGNKTYSIGREFGIETILDNVKYLPTSVNTYIRNLNFEDTAKLATSLILKNQLNEG